MFQIPDCLTKILRHGKKLKKDCHFFSLINTFYKLHQRFHTATPSEKAVLRKTLDSLAKIIEEKSKSHSCFPEMCFDCPGMKKCLNCEKQDNCVTILRTFEDNKKKK